MATSVTLEVLRQHLEEFGWHQYRLVDEPDEKEGLIQTGYQSGAGTQGIVIDPMVELNALTIMALRVVSAPMETTESGRLHELLLAIAMINYQSILTWFGYDATAGEVSLRTSMAIDENDVSYEQFAHCINAIEFGVAAFGPNLKAVLAGEMDAKQACVPAPPDPAPPSIAELRQLLAMMEAIEAEKQANQPEE